MMGSPLLLAGLVGALLLGGAVLTARGAVPTVPRLGDALASLDGRASEQEDWAIQASDRSERLGVWVYRTLRIPLTARQLASLHLRGLPIAEFVAEKTIFALLGMVLASCGSFLLGSFISVGWTLPAVAVLAAAVVGFFVPDLRLGLGEAKVKADADEALFTFFDLVTLERLSNLSAPQAMQSAAQLSDNPLFLRIRSALERARLEQRPPYGELKRLAHDIKLPELVDIADVMSLDESGAALSGALRARVKELRDAHLTEQKIAAHSLSERMTIYMVIPAMVFALIFLTPPLLRLVS